MNSTNQDRCRSDDFFVVGIGASAGGLEALEEMFLEISADIYAAIIVIQHLSPHYKSLMPEILERKTSLPIIVAGNGDELVPGVVFLISPGTNLTLEDGVFRVVKQPSGLNKPIDILFESMGRELGNRAIGVILSGSGTDGSLGIQVIKGSGGQTIAQLPEEARFDSMPRNAIGLGTIDMVLPVRSIAAQLNAICRMDVDTSSDQKDLIPPDFPSVRKDILAILTRDGGIDFSLYKRNGVDRRIARRISALNISDATTYLDVLQSNRDEVKHLLRELLIRVTAFFRDSEVFSVVESTILPLLFRLQPDDEELRIWVAGCSTGEEAYSLAMILERYRESHTLRCRIKIFATDIDPANLEFAQQGIYPETAATAIPPEFLHNYFRRTAEGFQVEKRIREMVIFARHNLIEDAPFSRLHLVSCRNLLIYLQPQAQERAMQSFHFSLGANGLLLLGTSESLGRCAHMFRQIDPRQRIFEKVSQHTQFSNLSGLRVQRDTTFSPRASQKGDELRKANTQLATLIRKLVPSGIIVTRSGEIVRIIGNVNRFIQVSEGPLGTALHSLLAKELCMVIDVLIQKADDSGAGAHASVVPFRRQGQEGRERAYVGVIPLSDGENEPEQPKTFLITLAPAEEGHTDQPFGPTLSTGVLNYPLQGEEVLSLEQEIERTRADLRATVEALEASNEELQTTNEELQATNEELFAANEELQSTNEELQSVNEELLTVNHEHQGKIGELTDLTNDMEAFLDISKIGALFLDPNLNLRRFTAMSQRFFNLLAHDIGRPMAYISHCFPGHDFIRDIRLAMDSREIVSRDLTTSSGENVTMEIVVLRHPQETEVRMIIVRISSADGQSPASAGTPGAPRNAH